MGGVSGDLYDRKMKMETNDELAQQGLTIVSGDKIPQKAGFNPLYLHAVIGPNNESGIMCGEQVLKSLNYSDYARNRTRRTEAVCEMERM